MENDTEEFETPSLAKEIATSFVISTATTAGVVTGFIAVGLALNAVKELKARRAAKKTPQPVS